MIFITQLIYIKPGQEQSFHEFENLAIPLISKYNGQLMLRVRLADSDIVEGSIDTPYEMHLVRFPSEADLQNFMMDESRKKFLHLKEASVQSALMYKGSRL